ncbi:MAG: FMN-binding negative transcriptional regulator [Cumulibacter sp.]
MTDMYLPKHFAIPDDDVRDVLENLGAADLVTPTAGGLASTFMPMLYDEQLGALYGHFALQNEHWKAEPTGDSLVIVHGSDSYITPMWYPSKSQHGRVVPTWNHLTINICGELIVHHDLDWLRANVTRLTEHFEQPFAERWQLSDAPAAFIDGQLRAIKGMELLIHSVQAKAKHSQNRPPADRQGVIDGLRAVGDFDGAGAVAHYNPANRSEE